MTVISADASGRSLGDMLPRDRMINTQDLARVFNVSRPTITAWTREGRIPPPIKIGNKLLWRRDVLVGLLGG